MDRVGGRAEVREREGTVHGKGRDGTAKAAGTNGVARAARARVARDRAEARVNVTTLMTHGASGMAAGECLNELAAFNPCDD